MKSDLRLILPVLLAVVLAMGCQLKKGATNDSTAEIDTTAIIEDTIIEINESELLLAKFRNIDFDDTLGHTEPYAYYYMVDTLLAGNYIRYGIVESIAASDSIYVLRLAGSDTIDSYSGAGDNAKIFINPNDKNDALIIDRELIHEKLDIANNSLYFDSLKLEMGMAQLKIREIRQDTILFEIFYAKFDSDVGYLSELKVLKENGKYTLWVRDISDEIVWD